MLICIAFDNVLQIRWKLSESRNPEPNTELTFRFSKVSPDQPEDMSWKFKSNGNDGLVSFREETSDICPYCNGMNESADVSRIPPKMQESAGTALPDALRLSMEMRDDVAGDNTGSTQSWRQVEKWLDICSTKHAKCPQSSLSTTPSKYPTRLLDLKAFGESGDDLRLVVPETHSLEGAYMTLSHCWGNLRINTLTADSLTGFCLKIEFSSLPKTFQDAIVITRRVGVRYLWIDSLCIIQDGEGSTEDWLRESATMDMVYHNSFLNIGATGATDGRQGCFHDRDYSEIFRPVIYKSECKLHQDKYLQPYHLVEPDFLEDTLLSEPLLTRGWVFQERFLSPRMLHFGSKQLFWECNEMQACETFPLHILSSTPLPALRRLTLDPTNQDDEYELSYLGCYKWYQIVQEYTTKNLTRGQDKLIALSGVARQFAARALPENVKYWAGMWSSDMPRGLLWKTTDKKAVRPSEYRAPSWSWASVDGQIGRPFTGTVSGKYLFQLYEANIEYKPDQYGMITSGILFVQGSVISLQCVRRDGMLALTYEGKDIERSTWFPDEMPVSLPQSFLCLCFHTGSWGMHGLTLKQNGNLPEYSRTGVFQIMPENSASAPDEWIYPESPFKELWNMDLEEEDIFAIV